jgi:hypothetical protein
VRDRAPEALATATAALLAAAGCALLAGAARPASGAARSEEFQRLVGGLGSGTATALSPCAQAFDPGLGEDCSCGMDPVPGGFAFCPHHSGASLRR